jgi:hypothetical protein
MEVEGRVGFSQEKIGIGERRHLTWAEECRQRLEVGKSRPDDGEPGLAGCGKVREEMVGHAV